MKKIVLLTACLLVSSIFTGCNNSSVAQNENDIKSTSKLNTTTLVTTTNTDLNNENSKILSNEEFPVEKCIYNCNEFSLICKSITKQGIEFEYENKLNNNVEIYLTISLDGVVAPLWQTTDESTIAANEKKSIYMHGDIQAVSHKYMSIDGIVFNGNNNIEFQLCDFDLGGVKNIDDTIDGKIIYSTENLQVEYLGADPQGLNFKVINKRKESIVFGAETLTISMNNENDDNDYAITVSTLPANSQGEYSVDILSYNENYFSDNLVSFEGVLEARIKNDIVDRFPIYYDTQQGITEKEEKSLTESAYIEATNITTNDLIKETNALGTWYYYKNLQLLSDENEWIENPLNTKGSVSQTAIYMKIARCLDGFGICREAGNNWEEYCEWLIGFTPKDRDEFVPYVENAIQFITAKEPLKKIMGKFESLNSVDGTFDYENKKFNFQINSLKECSKEMKISEEMLGYIFAFLNVYDAEISFNGDTCSFDYEASYDFEY